MDDFYRENILDHYRNPRGRGLREPFDAEVMHVNPTCGDEITLRVAVGTDGEPVLKDVSYWNQGCSISQASASILCEELEGATVSEALAMTDEFVNLMHGEQVDEESLGDLIAFEGVAKYPARVKCALLAWMALKDAISQSHPDLAEPIDGDLTEISVADPQRHELNTD